MAIDVLASILERKRRENRRRRAHSRLSATLRCEVDVDRSLVGLRALRRGSHQLPRVIAEIKHHSPSAGLIRARVPGGVAEIARGYESGGAAAVSVLCDGPGFGGTPLDVRRVSAAVCVPVLFKEFVLDEQQITLARLCGATMVLLLVRAMTPAHLDRLVDAVSALGMAPVVEAADADELAVALRTSAIIVGVNARDLRTFEMDGAEARRLVDKIPADRIAVYMSGVRAAADLQSIAGGRADAVLIGEGLMRSDEPGRELAAWLTQAAR